MFPYYGQMGIPQVTPSSNFPAPSNTSQLMALRFGGLNPYTGMGPFGPLDPTALSGFRCFDPRARFIQEEPKPQHSYIGLIAMGILSSPDKKLVLSDIYQWILDNYPYFRARGPGWRNSIRHNLSLNDCFIKAGRSANGKGHYWAIHPANIEDFKRGDFRRRRAQRKVRKAMGLSVPDDEEDEDDESPAITPPAGMTPAHLASTLASNGAMPPPFSMFAAAAAAANNGPLSPGKLGKLAASGIQLPPGLNEFAMGLNGIGFGLHSGMHQAPGIFGLGSPKENTDVKKPKRHFDVESLLDINQQKSSDTEKSGESDTGEQVAPDVRAEHQTSTGSPLLQTGVTTTESSSNPFNFGVLQNPFNQNVPFPFSSSLLPAAAAAGLLGPWCSFPNQVQASLSNPMTTNALGMLSPQMFWSSATAALSAAANGGLQIPGGNLSISKEQPIEIKSESVSHIDNIPEPAVSTQNRSSSPTSAEKWQESFAKIMARSYHGRNVVKEESVAQTKN